MKDNGHFNVQSGPPIAMVAILGRKIALLDYKISLFLQTHLAVGDWVWVPLRERWHVGLVWSCKLHSPHANLVHILDKITEIPAISRSSLQLLRFAATYYKQNLSEMLSLVCYHKLFLKELCIQAADEQALSSAFVATQPAAAAIFHFLQTKRHKSCTARHIYRHFKAVYPSKTMRLALEAGISARVLRIPPLESVSPSLQSLSQANTHSEPMPAMQYSAEQQIACDAIKKALFKNAFQTVLLHGITGSGKTAVYLNAIALVVQQGKQAIVLVPEIALTPQLLEQFQSRFGDRVALFHSGLKAKERSLQYRRVLNEEVSIVLGARSALFLPLSRLGLIVVDEEHDSSFKQDTAPRYQARDLAIYRARLEQAVIVLGSATPSLESYAHAQSGRYGYLRLAERPKSRLLPTVACIDMKCKDQRAAGQLLSIPLQHAMAETLHAGKQIILLLNRRGFAPYLFCEACGFHFRCQACDVALTYYRLKNHLLCHYCAKQQKVPTQCPQCQSTSLIYSGAGTEQLEAQIHQQFPDFTCLRLDKDSANTLQRLHHTLEHFRSGKSKILIGTQMVAKGHDFPNVALVGILQADAALNMPDFRAAERTFQLLTQVSGRAGRADTPGHVMIQTYQPDHYSIQFALKHDFLGFAHAELQYRQELGYPPYGHLAMLRFQGKDEQKVREWAEGWIRSLRHPLVRVSALIPSPLARLQGRWRFQVLLRSSSRKALHESLSQLPSHEKPPARVRCSIDIDPVDML
jgi:primosomal protein N' (replication factor Y)